MTFPSHLKPSKNLAEFFLYYMGLYTHIEQFLGSMLMMQTGMEYGYYNIVVGNQRTTDIIAKLEKLFKKQVLEEEVIEQSKIAFRHLRDLTDLRDRMVHSGVAQLDNGKIQVGLRLHLKSEITGYSYDHFTLDELEAARVDLDRIFQFIGAYLLPMAISPAELAARRAFWSVKPPPWAFALPKTSPRTDI